MDGRVRFAVTLFAVINNDAIMNFISLSFQTSVFNNSRRGS